MGVCRVTCAGDSVCPDGMICMTMNKDDICVWPE
jgi:hypothetical protein